ncbi:MAG: hypothetical protein V3U57_08110 [Robiginitomaculum sp.]
MTKLKLKLKLIRKGLLGTSAIALFAASNAFAVGTTAGTNVQNTFSLNYDVSGVAQTTIDTGPSGTNKPTEFTVDRMIDLTVATAGKKTVAPGALDQELTFSVTNKGNDVQAYDFVLVNETGDNFDTTGLNITYYVDDGNNLCDASDITGTGTAYTPGSGAASLDVAADATLCIIVDGDIAATVKDTNESKVSLVADTVEPTTAVAPLVAGAKVIADADGNTLKGLAENVLVDGAGTSNELANAGDHSATGTYIVASSDLTATKAVTIFSQDGSGCTTIPGTPGTGAQYAIPGACVQYVITVINNGKTAAAAGIAITDILPDNLTYITGEKSTDLTGGTFTGPSTDTDCGSSTGACTISVSGSTLAASKTGTVTIRALIK